MGIVQIQLVDLFTTPVIKMMTLRSKPKKPYHPRARLEGHNVQIQPRHGTCLVVQSIDRTISGCFRNFGAASKYRP